MAAPHFDSLSNKYTACQFIKVDVDKLNDVAAQCRVTSMPTFQIYRSGQKLHEVVGANIPAIENFIIGLGGGFQSFSGSGRTLGGGSGGKAGTAYVNPWADSANFDRKKTEQKDEKSNDKKNNEEDEDVDPELVKSLIAKKQTKGKNYLQELKEKQKNESGEGKGKAPDMSDEQKIELLEKTVNSAFLGDLLEMGISKIRAIKSLLEVGNSNINDAIDWLEQHQNDEDIDKIPEFTVETEEEKESRKKEKLEAIKLQLKENRRVREEESQKESLEREKKRRILGKNTQDSLKKWEDEQRLRERELQKKAEREDKERKRMLKKQVKIDNLNRKLDRLEGTGNQEEIEKLRREIAKLEGKDYEESKFTPKISTTESKITPTSQPSQLSQSKSTDNSIIRIRMLDGETITANFSSKDSLYTIWQHVQKLSPGNYTLMTPFPRKTYQRNELQNTTVEAAGLSPRGNVICTDMYDI